MKLTLTIALLIISAVSFGQTTKQDTLPCRALYSDPQSSADNKRVSVTNFYVVLKDGKPVKFLMRDKRRETSMEIWEYRLSDEPRFPTKKRE